MQRLRFRHLPFFGRIVLAVLLLGQLLLAAQFCANPQAMIGSPHHAGFSHHSHSGTQTSDVNCDTMPSQACFMQIVQDDQADPSFPPSLPMVILLIVYFFLPRRITYPAVTIPHTLLTRQSDPPLSIRFCRFHN